MAPLDQTGKARPGLSLEFTSREDSSREVERRGWNTGRPGKYGTVGKPRPWWSDATAWAGYAMTTTTTSSHFHSFTFYMFH